MRLLIISNHLAMPGNPESDSFIRERVAGLRSAGNEVKVVPFRAVSLGHQVASLMRFRSLAPRGWVRMAHHDSDVLHGSISAVNYALMRSGRSEPACAQAARWIRSEVGGRRWDAVIGHGAYGVAAAGVAREFSVLTGTPYFAVGHGSDINFMSKGNRNYLGEVFGEATAAFYVSHALLKKAASLGIATDNAHVTPNGVDGRVFKPTTRDESKDRPQLLFVGNLIPVKGADRLPAIMSALRSQGCVADLTIIGSGPLARQLRESMPAEDTQFLGFQSRAQVAAAMSQSDALLLPSRSEGWPCVVLEAQATGTPVIATGTGGTAEAVGNVGRVVNAEPFEPALFARAITEQIAAPDREAATARALSFDWIALGKAEGNLIREALTEALTDGPNRQSNWLHHPKERQ